jgi:hypothetical protein
MHEEHSQPSRRTSFLNKEVRDITAGCIRAGILRALAVVVLCTTANAQPWGTSAPSPAVISSEQEYWWLANQQQFTSQSQNRLANESFAPSYVPVDPPSTQNTTVQWQSPTAASPYTSSIYNSRVNPALAPSQQSAILTPQEIYPQQILPDQSNSGQLPSDSEMSNFFGTNPGGACSTTCVNPDYNTGEPWTHQFLPDGLIYRSYLAGPRESRMRSYFFNKEGYGNLWDITLGGRVGLWRYGTTNTYFPEGWQIDLEGAATPRLDFEHNMNVVSADFRAGLPITYGIGPWRTKFGYYHLSSHLGDEQLIEFPNTPRYNYTRDALIIGQSYYILPTTRVYAETSWAFNSDVAEPWEFQFGIEYAPALPTGLHGAPYAAVNGLLREEVNYSGSLTVQAGWAWREGPSAHLLRVGLEYFNGLSDQGQFWNQFEQKIGAGIWFDY